MNKSIGFIDTNLGLDHAIACAKDMDVIYYIASGGAYPYLKDERSGDGFEGIHKVDSMARAVDCDVIMFLDCYFGRDADVLREKGYKCNGAPEYWCKIENDRRFGWKEMQAMGVGVPDGVIIKGALETVDYIKQNQDGTRVFYIKTNKYRGSKETGGGVTNWVEALVAISSGNFGPYMEDMEFLVQFACSGKEFGVDLMCNGHDILRPYLITCEEKGSGTVGRWVENSLLDSILINKVLPKIVETDYRGYLCFEFFIDEKSRIQVHDPCARPGYPCSAIQNHVITNYPECVCAMASGDDIRVETNGHPYAIQVGLYTDDKDTPRTIRFDEILRPNVGFRRVVWKAGDYWYLPGDFLVATAIASSDDLEDGIDWATEIAGKIECSNSAIPGRFKEDVMVKIKALNSWDIGLEI